MFGRVGMGSLAQVGGHRTHGTPTAGAASAGAAAPVLRGLQGLMVRRQSSRKSVEGNSSPAGGRLFRRLAALWHRLLGWESTASAARSAASIPSPDQAESDAVIGRWVARWIPRRPAPGGVQCYWVWRGVETRDSVFPGNQDAPPRVKDAPHFYLNGSRIYRDWGYPDGPSSVPFMEVRRRRIYPAEALLADTESRVLYDITGVPVRQGGYETRIRRNPRFGTPDDPP